MTRHSLIIAAMVAIARQLDITIAAEGVETVSELRVLRAAGIRLFQGYYFAKPAIGQLPEVKGLGGTAESQAA